MFTLWIGGEPDTHIKACMIHNMQHDLHLIAECNWIHAQQFTPVQKLIEKYQHDLDYKKLLTIWDNPKNISDILRLFYLSENPNETYIDADCILHEPLQDSNLIQFPSVQKAVEELGAKHNFVPDMQAFQCTPQEHFEIFLIKGHGRRGFFLEWIHAWATAFAYKGGVVEAMLRFPFHWSPIPASKYTHFSKKKSWTVA